MNPHVLPKGVQSPHVNPHVLPLGVQSPHVNPHVFPLGVQSPHVNPHVLSLGVLEGPHVQGSSSVHCLTEAAITQKICTFRKDACVKAIVGFSRQLLACLRQMTVIGNMSPAPSITGRGGRIGRALVSCVGDHVFKPQLSQTNDL